MHLPSQHIIAKLHEHTQEIDSHRYEIFKLELWWYPETETVEGFKITSYGSTLTKEDIKQIPAGDSSDIEKLYQNKVGAGAPTPTQVGSRDPTYPSYSMHSPQEQEIEKEEEEQIGRPQGSPLQKDTVPAKSQSGDCSYSEELLRKILIDKLSQLTDKQKVALLLNCLKYTNRQASKVMRINESTYREHLESALKKLHKQGWSRGSNLPVFGSNLPVFGSDLLVWGTYPLTPNKK